MERRPASSEASRARFRFFAHLAVEAFERQKTPVFMPFSPEKVSLDRLHALALLVGGILDRYVLLYLGRSAKVRARFADFPSPRAKS